MLGAAAHIWSCFCFSSNFTRKRGTFIINLSCVPSPIFSTLSRASTLNMTRLPSTDTTSALRNTSAPTGVAARCSILTTVPTESHSESCITCSLRRSRHVSSISAIMAGVERTFSPSQRKIVVWFELTVMVRSFEAPILTVKSMTYRDHKLSFKLVHEHVHTFFILILLLLPSCKRKSILLLKEFPVAYILSAVNHRSIYWIFITCLSMIKKSALASVSAADVTNVSSANSCAPLKFIWLVWSSVTFSFIFLFPITAATIVVCSIIITAATIVVCSVISTFSSLG